MTKPTKPPTTHIATSTATDITVRGKSLCNDLLGKVTFTEMTYFLIAGHLPTPGQAAVIDVCLVALVELHDRPQERLHVRGPPILCHRSTVAPCCRCSALAC